MKWYSLFLQKQNVSKVKIAAYLRLYMLEIGTNQVSMVLNLLIHYFRFVLRLKQRLCYETSSIRRLRLLAVHLIAFIKKSFIKKDIFCEIQFNHFKPEYERQVH
jgi:hypothetical protein